MVGVIYARYSSSSQTEQSIEGQLKVCYNYARNNNISIVKEYIDRAQSGKTDDRTEFQKMLRESKKKQFQVVLVYALDRFGRNLHQSVDNEHKLEKNGVVLMSATENFSNDPAGRLNRNMMMSFAQYYSDELSQKIKRGIGIKVEKGLAISGGTPLGYKVVDKKYVIDEEKAPIVREVFEKYASGMSIKQIYDDLNSRGLKSSKGKEFNKNSMHTLLKNRKYLGIYIHKEVEIQGGMPQIVDEELFNKVAEKMALNKKLPARARAIDEYLLTTKLFCGECKEMMIGHSSNKISKGGVKYNYYKCKGATTHSGCKKKMVLKDRIENIVVDECRKVLSPRNIKRIAKEIVKIAESYDDKAELNRLDGLIKKAKKETDNQMASLRVCDSDMVRDMIFKDLEKIAAELKAYEKQYQLETARRYTITEKEVIAFLTKLANGDISDIVYRRTLVKFLVNRIYLYDERFTITFNSGDDEVTITDVLLADIHKGVGGARVCLLNSEAHSKKP